MVPELADKLLVAGVVDGRNIWRTDLDKALATLGTLLGSARALAVSTSCSTLHVPYTLDAEDELDDNLRGWLAFAAQKYDEVGVLARALRNGRESERDAFEASAAALATRTSDPRVHVPAVRARLAAVTDTDITRMPAAERIAAQNSQLGLCLLYTSPSPRDLSTSRMPSSA